MASYPLAFVVFTSGRETDTERWRRERRVESSVLAAVNARGVEEVYAVI